jgi:hypothetical protein
MGRRRTPTDADRDRIRRCRSASVGVRFLHGPGCGGIAARTRRFVVPNTAKLANGWSDVNRM